MRDRTHLLSLPKEIRDQIYEAFLDLEVPLTLSTSATLKKLSSCLFIPERIPRPLSAALLNCNRQLRSEVSHALSRRSSTYSLDLLLLKLVNMDPRRQIIPEWTSIPALPIIRAKCFHIRLQAKQWIRYHRERSDCIDAEYMTLFHLINRLFAYGPTFDNSGSPAPIFIEELEVKVMPKAGIPGGIVGYYERKSSEVASRFKRPLDLAARSPLEGKLGRITLRLGGEVIRQWSVKEDKGISREQWERYGWVS